MTAPDNYFVNPKPWTEIRIGGRLMRSALVEINGVATEDEWAKQKSKETSGSNNVFKGTKYNEPELTFEAVDAEDFDDLRALWDLLAPIPGQGQATSGTGANATTPAGSPKQTAAQSQAQLAALAQVKVNADGTLDTSTVTPATGLKTGEDALGGVNAGDSSGTGTPDPGPRPPTVPIDHPLLRWHGITAVARSKWEGPTFTATNSLRVKLKLIADKPLTPAGAGGMGPPDPQAQLQAVANIKINPDGTIDQSSVTPQANINKDAAAGAAGV